MAAYRLPISISDSTIRLLCGTCCDVGIPLLAISGLCPRMTQSGPLRVPATALKAVETARIAIRKVVPWPGYTYLAAALGQLGDAKEARRAREDLEKARPGITLDFIRKHIPSVPTEYLDALLDGLRKAGLTEQ